MQLIIDLLITNGQPTVLSPDKPLMQEHIPVIAANTDLLWIAEAPLPRCVTLGNLVKISPATDFNWYNSNKNFLYLKTPIRQL